MSEEEQIERMKRNQERLINRKKQSVSTLSAQRPSQGSETAVEVCQLSVNESLHEILYNSDSSEYSFRPLSL